jgi:hypothetical protein
MKISKSKPKKITILCTFKAWSRAEFEHLPRQDSKHAQRQDLKHTQRQDLKHERRQDLKVHKIEIFLASILKFVLFLY